MAQFNAIRAEEQMTIQMGGAMWSQLDQYRLELSETFGFDLSMDQTIGFLLKHRKPVAIQTPEPLEVLQPLLPGPYGGKPLTLQEKERLHELVATHMKTGNKIMAIKEVRGIAEIGLKEAKDYVERLYPPTPF